jgi:hypothetical protein
MQHSTQIASKGLKMRGYHMGIVLFQTTEPLQTYGTRYNTN